MGDEQVWGRIDGKLLSRGVVALGSSCWEAARACARLAADGGCEGEAEELEEWAQDLEALAADHGWLALGERGPAPFIKPSPDHPWTHAFLGDCLAKMLIAKACKEEAGEARAKPGESSEERAQREADSLPAPWREQLWQVDYARMTKAIVKGPANTLEAGEAPSLVAASRSLSEARAKAERAAGICRRMWKSGGREGMGPARLWALRLCMAMPSHLGSHRGFVPQDAQVEWSGMEARLSAQKSYAGYLSEPRAGVGGEGFWGSVGAGGVDLAAAKLFDSEERAVRYFERQGFASYSVVEVSVGVERVARSKGPVPDGLLAAVARKERAQLERALERADVEQLRARLAQLEARAHAAPGAAAAPAKRGGRL